jgi:hypothetical protein
MRVLAKCHPVRPTCVTNGEGRPLPCRGQCGVLRDGGMAVELSGGPSRPAFGPCLGVSEDISDSDRVPASKD